METIINRNQQLPKAYIIALLTLFVLFALFALIGLTFHISALEILNWPARFSKQNYFLIGYISFVFAIICLELFYRKQNHQTNNFNVSEIKRKKILRRRIFMYKLKKRFNLNYSSTESDFIKHEKISDLKFTRQEVLKEYQLIESRYNDLQKATKLGNIYKQKVIIIFKDSESIKHTLATIWQADKNYLFLKGGVTIPVPNIYKIEF